MSARKQVLNTFELLEAIYLYTTTFEIQVATAVNSHFRNVIERSKPLKDRVLALRLHSPGLFATHSKYSQRHLSRSRTWHIFAPTTSGNAVLFVLQIPSWGVEIFLIAEIDQNHLQVLAGPKRKCRVLLVDNKYGRNIRVWDADGQWVCETASLSTVGGGPSVLVQYLEMFYPSRQNEEVFYIGGG